ncbi:MAG: glycosyltransferase family 2 protein [Syntrophobacteraceae bacterium]|jgi:dolichol-phosphate mannosyltransferase
MQDVSVSVIIPCYNEEAVISETYTRVKKVLIENGYKKHEILFIDDGSRDRTLDILRELVARDKSVTVLRFSRNFGHQAAVCAGINNCREDVAIIIDADLQDPPELIPDMIRMHLVEGYNVVYGVRAKREGESFFKKFTAKIFYRLLASLSDVPIPLDTGDFRLIDRAVIDEFKCLSEKNKYIRGLISWLGFKQGPIMYSRDPRLGGETKYPLYKMLRFAMTGLLYFSRKPLKLAIMTGFACIAAGLLMLAYVFIAKFYPGMGIVKGWTSTLIIIIFFSGVQLMTVGVMGEYIGSIFDEVKNRPEYIIRERLNYTPSQQ